MEVEHYLDRRHPDVQAIQRLVEERFGSYEPDYDALSGEPMNTYLEMELRLDLPDPYRFELNHATMYSDLVGGTAVFTAY